MRSVTTKSLDLRVANLDCEGDAAAIHRGLKDFPGVVDLEVYPSSARLSVTYDASETTPVALREQLAGLGFPPQRGTDLPQTPKPSQNPKVVTSALSGVLLLAGWLLCLSGVSASVSTLVYVVAAVTGGYFFAREALETLFFERRVGIELLMSVAAVTATSLGQAGEGAMLAFLYSMSEAAEGYTGDKTRSAIRALMNLVPKTTLVKRGEKEIEIPVEEIAVGEVFVVKPGGSVPTDGEIVTGASSVDQAPVTGESMPVEKRAGDILFAGSINGEGALEVRATKTFRDNTIARIIQMVDEAQERKGKSQRFIERFGARYSPLVLLSGLLIATIPPLAFAASWEVWLSRATVFIVAAAPCALVISIPITLVAALGTGARQGVLIKGGVYLEELAKVRVVAFDKTGTLTRGQPDVTEVIVYREKSVSSEEALLSLAAGIESRSEHPLARAIVRHAKRKEVAPQELSEFHSRIGAGVSARWNNTVIYAGSPEMFRERLGRDVTDDGIETLQLEGKTVVLVGNDDTVFGAIAIRDEIRPNARDTIARLRRQGIEKVVMLTGDNARTATAIARELSIEEVFAGLSPEDKAGKVRELAERDGHVAMVGDGVNDAPALAEATVGIAMGTAGTDVALETADVALMADDLEKLIYALALARRNETVVRQNLLLSAVVIGTLVIGALTGSFSLPIAVLGHELSEFVVIGSGLRMLRA